MAPTSIRFAFAAIACFLAISLLPASSQADDATRISFLESEIQKLRTQLGEQDRRIQRLEAELERRGGVAPPDWRTERPAAHAPTKGSEAPGPLTRHSPEAWDRIAKGMTQEEVVKILGEPTGVESVDDYKTLFYREVMADGEPISGHVNLREDRVVAIRKPAVGE